MTTPPEQPLRGLFVSEGQLVWLRDAEPPAGMRLYAVGDVHGCLDALEEIHARIAADLEARPVADWRLIHVGDYVDRGADSRGVVEYLRRRCAAERRIDCLLGNHDEMFLEALSGNPRWADVWLMNGGDRTLASYGLSREDFELRLWHGRGFDDVIPPAHVAFLRSLPRSLRYGDYFFAHAGIDPDVPLAAQDDEALLWIRARFLTDEREHGAVVVHGHTPVREIDVRANRLGIDTGAVFGRELSCVVLEGRQRARLGADGTEPLILPVR